MAGAIAELYDCFYSYEKGGDLKKTKQTFVGRQSNAETARLIAEFVVKTIMKAGWAYQKSVSGANRQAHDFHVGCAKRVADRARALWREANAEAIAARQAAAAEQQRMRDLYSPNMGALKPGTYLIREAGKDCCEIQRHTLTEEMAMVYYRNLKAKPGKVYFIVVKPTDGECHVPKYNFEYYFDLQELPQSRARSKSRSVATLKDYAAYSAGQSHGDSIGLRVQVGATQSGKLN